MKLTDGKPLIYLITDGSMTDLNLAFASKRFFKLVCEAVSNNISLIQIREKQITTRNLLDLAVKARELCSGSQTRLLINDRIDVALAAEADGVHLTSHSIKPETVRRFVPKDFLIGVSTHSVDELKTAKQGADLAVIGPVYATPAKGDSFGLEELKSAVTTVAPFPVLALGGIDASNYRDVLATGATGFAAIRFLNDAENLRMLSKEYSL